MRSTGEVTRSGLHAPRVSYGLPVRNGERYIRRAIDSLLAQDFDDFEIVISDNASDDLTGPICKDYASRDHRIRYSLNDSNIGQIANVNKVFELSRGTYYRFIGADDWLEPEYTMRCVEILDAHPEWIGVSTYYDFHREDGSCSYLEYTGERLESRMPHRRFGRMMWLLLADGRISDLLYSIIRREALLKTNLLRYVPSTDKVLAAELSLVGAFGHIPERLAHRRWESVDRNKLISRYAASRTKEIEDSVCRLCATFLDVSLKTPTALTRWQKAYCALAVARYYLRQTNRNLYRGWRNLMRRLPGYSLLKRLIKGNPSDDAP